MVHHKAKRKNPSYLLLLPLLLLLVLLAVTLYALNKRIELRSHATAATTLSFTPLSSPVSPLKQELNTSTSYDILLRPGSNIVSFVQLEILYDPAKLGPTDGIPVFQPNPTVIPTVVEGPVYSDGKVLVSLSVGANRDGVITSPAKIGTITLKALSVSDTPTALTFGPQTKVLSIGRSDESSENVLSTTSPALIAISTTPQSITPKEQTIDPHTGALLLTLSLHGIGSSGDSVNPTSTTSNKNPLHPTRNVSILLSSSSSSTDQNILGSVTYDVATGKFSGTIPLPSVAEGTYSIRVKTDQYLRRAVPGKIAVHLGSVTKVPEVALIGGDVNNDNKINILDYGILIGCYSDLKPALSCTASQKDAADLNDDGKVNQSDYNFFLRESPTMIGD